MATTIFNRRDIGYTIISRFEEAYRNFLINKLTIKHADFRDGIPSNIVSRINERSENLFFDDPAYFFQNSDFPDLLEISIYKDNFNDFFTEGIDKQTLSTSMSQLYSLRCKIAHVKGFFTSIDLDKLIELAKIVAVFFNDDKSFINLIKEIEINPEKVAIKVPVDFNIDFLESNGIINNLPTPDYEYEGGFVGREDDIREIIKYLQREKFNVVTITGAGGVGKTSLALKVIEEITQKPQTKRFDAIIWLSAKENRLSPFGIEDIEPSFKSFEEILDTITNVLGFAPTGETQTIEEKEEMVSTLFEMVSSILVVVDNLETVTDQRVINFVIDAPEQVKFLITSRKGLGQVERRYELKQLKEKEAVYLFRQIAKDKQISSLQRLDDKLIKKYVNKVSNYPLAIKWVIGQVARGRDINKVIDSIDDATGDIAKFCFEQIFLLLNNCSRNILFALCCFDEAPAASLLRYVVDIDNLTFEDSIEELILVSLVIPEQYKNEQEEIGTKYNILSLTKGYVRQQLNQDIAQKEKLMSRIAEVENTVTATEQAKREYRFSLHNLGAVTEEEKISAIFIQTAFQKYQAGLYDDAIFNYTKAVNIAPRFSSAYRNWAVMESYENHLLEADQLMSKAAELNSTDPQIWLLWGNIKRKANKIVEADEKYKKAYDITKDNHIILNAYGQTRGRLGDYEKSYKLFEDALAIDGIYSKKHEIINRTSMAEMLLQWAESLLRDRNPEASKEKLDRAVEECFKAIEFDPKDLKSRGILNKCYYKIGKYYNTIKDFKNAKKYFDKSLIMKPEGFKVVRYRIKSGIELCKLLLIEGDFNQISLLLETIQQNSENIFHRHPEMLTEIHDLESKAGVKKTFVEGKIVHVNTISDFVLIEIVSDPGINYIGGKNDFIPILNSLSKDLTNKPITFVPKTYKANEKEKRIAKNITLTRK